MTPPHNTRPIQPVAPNGMELIFMYRCPHCSTNNTLLAPTQPAMAQCNNCELFFPLIPVDERSISYIKLMLANGRAAVDPDFL